MSPGSIRQAILGLTSHNIRFVGGSDSRPSGAVFSFLGAGGCGRVNLSNSRFVGEIQEGCPPQAAPRLWRPKGCSDLGGLALYDPGHWRDPGHLDQSGGAGVWGKPSDLLRSGDPRMARTVWVAEYRKWGISHHLPLPFLKIGRCVNVASFAGPRLEEESNERATCRNNCGPDFFGHS